MSGLRGDAGARVAERRRAIITVSRVAARRRHLAGCQTRWGPPSNSGRQNKGSVRNTDSCNISPGPGSHSISPLPTAPASATYINLLGVIDHTVVVTAGAAWGKCCLWAPSQDNKHTTVVFVLRSFSDVTFDMESVYVCVCMCQGNDGGTFWKGGAAVCSLTWLLRPC